MVSTDLLYRFAVGCRVGTDQSLSGSRNDNCSAAIRQQQVGGSRFFGDAPGRLPIAGRFMGLGLHAHGSKGRK